MLVRRVWPARASVRPPLDLDQVRRDVFRIFDAFSDDERTGVFPPANVSQTAEQIIVRCELPGMNIGDIKVTTAQNKLTIEGNRVIKREERVSYHRREREEGSFSRTFVLPVAFDSERVQATYNDGILTISLPKAEQAKPRQIVVKNG